MSRRGPTTGNFLLGEPQADRAGDYKALLLALVISLVAVILLQTPNILFFLLVYAAVLLLLCGVFAVGVEAQAAKRLRADRSGAHPGPKTLLPVRRLCGAAGPKEHGRFQIPAGIRLQEFYAVYFNYETMYLIPKRDVPAADADGVRAYFKKRCRRHTCRHK